MTKHNDLIVTCLICAALIAAIIFALGSSIVRIAVVL